MSPKGSPWFGIPSSNHRGVGFAIVARCSIQPLPVATAFKSPSVNFIHSKPTTPTAASSTSLRDAFSNKIVTVPSFLSAAHDPIGDNDNESRIDEFNPIASFTRPFITVGASALIAISLLFSPEAQAIPTATSTTPIPPTATSIDIDLRGLPALTRKAILNREALTTYLLQSAQSFEPILRLLSESDAVTVRPPTDVKAAIKSLLGGEAQFVINGNNVVDIRVESVPGVIVVRVINPNLPRLPFLKDGTAALKFVDEIVDVAPKELEKAAKEVEAIEQFLTWGAPAKAPIQFRGSTLDYFLSSKFLWGGREVRLPGSLGEVTNAEVLGVMMGGGVVVVYGASYAYYAALRQEEEREAAEKKAVAATRKKAKGAGATVTKEESSAKIDKQKSSPEKELDSLQEYVEIQDEKSRESSPLETPVRKDAATETIEVKAEETAKSIVNEEAGSYSWVAEVDDNSSADVLETENTQSKPKGRKRDAIKKLFRRGK